MTQQVSQRTSPLPPNHPVKQLMGLARQIALPHEYEPERFPSFPALERTAKLSFNQPSSFDVPSSVTRKMALFRQAAYPLWLERTITGEDTYCATYMTASAYGGNSDRPSSHSMSFNTGLYNWQNKNTAVNGKIAIGLTGVNPNPEVFTYPILAYDHATGPQPFVYLPLGANVMFVLRGNSLLPQRDIAVTFEEWDGPGEVHSLALGIENVAGNIGTAVSNPAGFTQGWFRPTVVMSAQDPGDYLPQVFIDMLVSIGNMSYAPSITTAGVVSVVPSTKTVFVPIAPPAEFVNSTLPWQSTRVTASAVLATNVTQVLNKGGTVLAGRMSPETVNPWEATAQNINLLHPAEKAFLPFESGLYTYCPPSTDLAIFWDYTLNNQNLASEPQYQKTPVFRLDNDAMVNYAFFTSPSNIESVALNVDWHIEFRTSSALFDVGMSTVTLETLHQAQIVLSQVGFFFENFDHKAILNAVINAVRKYGPAVAAVFSPAVGKAADLILSRLPEPGMTTTTVPVAQQPRTTRRRRKRRATAASSPVADKVQSVKKKGGLTMYLESVGRK